MTDTDRQIRELELKLNTLGESIIRLRERSAERDTKLREIESLLRDLAPQWAVQALGFIVVALALTSFAVTIWGMIGGDGVRWLTGLITFTLLIILILRGTA